MEKELFLHMTCLRWIINLGKSLNSSVLPVEKQVKSWCNKGQQLSAIKKTKTVVGKTRISTRFEIEHLHLH